MATLCRFLNFPYYQGFRISFFELGSAKKGSHNNRRHQWYQTDHGLPDSLGEVEAKAY
jgi:hypothetical protein